jgi:UDP:flavonoid glycosyltransferase YjiC (YdhE family)
MARHDHSIAVFVSPHGYGHAARACAVMQALAELDPAITFEVFTLVPEWFFADSLSCPFRYHPLLTDVGLAQTTPTVEDLDETLRQLAAFLPFGDRVLEELTAELRRLRCELVLADISPLGLAVAHRARIPSVLVENFTWDWIYEPYLADRPAFSGAIAALAELFSGADARIQTEPVCRRDGRWPAVPPVSREPRTPAAVVRRSLGLTADAPAVLITMGGVPWRLESLEVLETHREAFFVVPGASERITRRGRLVALPHRSGFFHPDLVHAVDAVIGKLGYSTVAETYAAGVPFGHVGRPTFRESPALAAFVRGALPSLPLTSEEVASGAWLEKLPALLALGRAHGTRANGAAATAGIVQGLLTFR